MLPSEQHSLFKLILAADRQGANDYVDAWAAGHCYADSLLELLEPAIREFGSQWAASDDISLAQGYIAGKIAEDIVNKALAEYTPTSILDEKRSVVIGNIEDDYHQLGRKLLGSFLTMHGWNVIDLGNDILAEEFVDEAVKANARVIGVSSMMYNHALNIRKVRDEIDKRGLTGKIQLAVGGAIFNEHLVLIEKVGGDGTAVNAIEAISLFEELWQRSLDQEQ